MFHMHDDLMRDICLSGFTKSFELAEVLETYIKSQKEPSAQITFDPLWAFQSV